MRRATVAAVLVVGGGLAAPACVSTPDRDAAARAEDDDPIADGTIAYPFVDEARPIGKDGPDEPLVIRSAVGDHEYTIEIPGGARDYDIQVPLADLGERDGDVLRGAKPKGLANPTATDRELVAALPRLDQRRPTDTALMDGAFGVGAAEGPRQAPSYTLGIAKVNEHFKRHEWEYALVELNALVAFYPTSPLLHKMKGTVLLRMRNLELAEHAWIRALELAPRDRALSVALARLQRRLVLSGRSRPAGAPGAAVQVGPPVAAPAIPAAVAAPAVTDQDAATVLSH